MFCILIKLINSNYLVWFKDFFLFDSSYSVGSCSRALPCIWFPLNCWYLYRQVLEIPGRVRWQFVPDCLCGGLMEEQFKGAILKNWFSPLALWEVCHRCWAVCIYQWVLLKCCLPSHSRTKTYFFLVATLKQIKSQYDDGPSSDLGGFMNMALC